MFQFSLHSTLAKLANQINATLSEKSDNNSVQATSLELLK